MSLLALTLGPLIEWPQSNKDRIIAVANERTLRHVSDEWFITAYEGVLVANSGGGTEDDSRKPTVKYFNFESISRGDEGLDHLANGVVQHLRYMRLDRLTKCYARLSIHRGQYRVALYMW